MKKPLTLEEFLKVRDYSARFCDEQSTLKEKQLRDTDKVIYIGRDGLLKRGMFLRRHPAHYCFIQVDGETTAKIEMCKVFKANKANVLYMNNLDETARKWLLRSKWF